MMASHTFRLPVPSSKTGWGHIEPAMQAIIADVSKWMAANQKAPGQVSFALEVTFTMKPLPTPWQQATTTRVFHARDHAKATYTLGLMTRQLDLDSSWYDPYIADYSETPSGMALLVTFHDASLAMLFKLAF